MSEQPPPPDHGDPEDGPRQPPSPQPPSPQPPSPYGAPPPGQPAYPPPALPAYPVSSTDRPHEQEGSGRIWLGIALSIPYLVVAGVVMGGLGNLGNGAGGDLAGLVGLAVFAAPFVMLFFRATRKVAIGLLIGFAALMILAAGACVALLAGLGSQGG